MTLFTAGQSTAEEIKIAVASNFAATISGLVEHYETISTDKVTLILGSTGKHYAQIKHGAPFDIFLAADSIRPKLLEQDGSALPDSRFTYAIGKLILWSPRAGFIDTEGDVLELNNFNFIAMANPKLAPYGLAAQQVLQSKNLWAVLKSKTVRGENIAQAFQYVKSGNAQLGFISYSQTKHPSLAISGSFWEIPSSLYSPIRQQAVLLKDKEAARAFLEFMKSDKALEIIHSFGYETPND